MEFVIAYPQAPIEHALNMKLPKEIYTNIVNGNTHVVNLIKNLYKKIGTSTEQVTHRQVIHHRFEIIIR